MSTNAKGPLERAVGAVWGAFIADALAMPGHWYYDRAKLARDYGDLDHFQAPREPHPDSILWRSHYECPGPRGDILQGRVKWWGRRGVHYHRELLAGENTLNLRLASRLGEWLKERVHYCVRAWLEEYIGFMLDPHSHKDTYIEEYHRAFFSRVGRGEEPSACRGNDPHIGGLAPVPVFCALLTGEEALAAIREHVGFSHSPEVVQAALAFAKMLSDVVAGSSPREAIARHCAPFAQPEILETWSRSDDLAVVGAKLSSACYIRDAFPASLFFAWKYAGRFRKGLVANARAGGDNCHRGVVVGALLGAEAGLGRLPADLIQGLKTPPRFVPVQKPLRS